MLKNDIDVLVDAISNHTESVNLSALRLKATELSGLESTDGLSFVHCFFNLRLLSIVYSDWLPLITSMNFFRHISL